MSLTNSLEKTGLSEKQAKVYLACLELGGGNVTNIAKKAKIQRTTCYPALNELLNLGLVSKSKQKKRGYFLAEDPKNLEQTAKTKLQTIQEILPQLNAVYNVLPQRPKISFYEGVGGIKTIFEEILQVAQEGDFIYAYTGLKPFPLYLPKLWLQDYVKRRVTKKVRMRFITPSLNFTKVSPPSQKELREVKLIPKGSWEFTADIQICRNKTIIVSPKENFIGIMIESKEIAEMLKMALELMWKGAGS